MLALALALSVPAHADRLDDLLARGEVVLVEADPDGAVRGVTAVTYVAAPPDAVWARLTDFGAYPTWMPGALQAESRPAGDGAVDVDWVLKVPGPNVKYTGHNDLDRAGWTITQEAISKNLRGSRWVWRLEPAGEGTVVYREAFATQITDNWLLNQLDDYKGMLDIGINVASPVIEVQALARACGAAP